MCLINYCSYYMHFEFFFFRNLAPESYTHYVYACLQASSG